MNTEHLEVGDTYFYPRIGPVEMTGRTMETLSGRYLRMTRWRALSETGVFAIPEANVSSVLRPIVTKSQVEEIFQSLADPTIPQVSRTHSKRYRHQCEKINEGNSLDLAEIVRDLYRRQVYKVPARLSDSEKRNLEGALRSLSLEVAIALGIKAEEAEKRITWATVKPIEDERVRKVIDGE